MNLSDAVKSIIKPHENDTLIPLTTVFGESLKDTEVLQEYPRPQLVRASYLNLNGWWDYTILTDAACHSNLIPDTFTGRILVPFSPEAALSGVSRLLKPDETLWYRIQLNMDMHPFSTGHHLILHFGAVDCLTEIYINGASVCIHEGGYLPFSVDITPNLLEHSNTLTVRVKDFTDTSSHARGKQVLKRGGIFYTSQSGIWQTVWMEWVPPSYIQRLQVDTDYDRRMATVTIYAHQQDTVPVSLEVYCKESMITKQSVNHSITKADFDTVQSTASDDSPTDVAYSMSFSIPEESFYPWSPEQPFLYTLKLTFGEDQIDSYFALRCFTIEKSDGKPVFCLNHKPCFLMGLLDQGYWPDGLYTAPSDEALIYDIETAKSLGFNMLRKHIKVEAARWYYHCDRLGMIVCQDMVNGGSTYRMPFINYLPTIIPFAASRIKDSSYSLFSRKDETVRLAWEAECLDTVEQLGVFPCIAIWVPFNEGWGQFDSLRITKLIKSKDPSRLVDSASGWFDQGGGDFVSIHNYFRPLTVPVKKWKERAFLLSEYGGYACHIKNHSSVERVFGYKRYDTLLAFQGAYHKLMQEALLPLQKQGCSGAVYTQLSDVEEEVNGLLTYDRRINKLSRL